VKFNLGRYLAPATTHDLTANNPRQANRRTGLAKLGGHQQNFVVDCDILSPAAQTVPGGDTCGALTGDSLNFRQAGARRR
jgi:hypothetical protein